ncbi:MAG: hypothetical protein ACREPJ_01420 [Rhodanobacteraceae bacterium]
MVDPALPARPRVALVFGDADAVGRLREAVGGHLEIVYETSAAEFDAARLADSGATAALVNLDGCDWLEDLQARLGDVGVAVVFNDPAISRNLKGFEQARWLRHLTAKLSGSTDYDPPRPRDTGADAPRARADSGDPLPDHAAAPPLLEPGFAKVSANDAAEPAFDAQVPVAVDIPEASAAPPDLDADGALGLDLDTEALSAMIDARLAETHGTAAPESTEVWRVADVEAAPAVALTPPATPGAQANTATNARTSAAPIDEDDVLKGLPSVDDWQLVDPDAPLAEAERPRQDDPSGPAVPADLAGLELVPVEIAMPIERHVEPVERWMQVGNLGQGRRVRQKEPAPAADEDRA